MSFKTSDAVGLAIKLNNSEIDDRKVRVQRCSKKQKAKKMVAGGKNNKEEQKGNKKSFVRNNVAKRPAKFIKNETNDPKKKKNKKKFSNKNPLKMIKTNKRPSNKFKL